MKIAKVNSGIPDTNMTVPTRLAVSMLIGCRLDTGMVVFGKARYYFFDGVWYLPKGRRFLIVAPPIGLAISFLPPYYTTIMVGGVPYYYANEVYYTAGPGGYVVVAPRPVKSARYRLRRQCLRRALPRSRPPEVKCQAARCRGSRCLSIPNRGRMKRNRRMIDMSVTVGPWARQGMTRPNQPSVCPKHKHSKNMRTINGPWVPALRHEGIRSDRTTCQARRRWSLRIFLRTNPAPRCGVRSF